MLKYECLDRIDSVGDSRFKTQLDLLYRTEVLKRFRSSMEYRALINDHSVDDLYSQYLMDVFISTNDVKEDELESLRFECQKKVKSLFTHMPITERRDKLAIAFRKTNWKYVKKQMDRHLVDYRNFPQSVCKDGNLGAVREDYYRILSISIITLNRISEKGIDLEDSNLFDKICEYMVIEIRSEFPWIYYRYNEQLTMIIPGVVENIIRCMKQYE